MIEFCHINTVKNLEIEIEKIKLRNKRVEIEKAWEISNERIVIIAILTCLTTILFMYIIGDSEPIINGIIATVGFFLSTLSLNIFKEMWIKNRKVI